MRLIDADALKTEINFSVTITGKDNAVEVKRLMELYNKAISDAPTIDAEPVKHGKWEKNEPLPSEWQYKCSKCGVPSKSNSHNFCPNCGSYMRGEEE